MRTADLGAPDAEPEDVGGRASDPIVRALEGRIATGAFPEGATLPAERDLMAEFKASRTVVREAIAALASRGLVENRPRFRPVVRKPGYDLAVATVGGIVRRLLTDRDGVRNLYESRVFLERALVRDAALHARKADLERLREALAENERAIPDSERFYRTDVRFHGLLYDIPRNPIFPAVHGAFTSWLAPHWTRMPRSPERNRMNWLNHRAILDAIVARDPEAADEALARHLHAAWEFVKATFEMET